MANTESKPRTFEEIMLMFDKIAADRAAWEAASKRRWAKHDKRMAKLKTESERRWAKHEKKMAALDEKYGGIGTSMGEHAEEFFQEAVRKRNRTFGGIHYVLMTPKMRGERGDLRDEYDIVLHNGDFITIIEVKYRFRRKDLHRFIKKKLANFRPLFPLYADKQIYLCIAAFSFEDGVVEEAKSFGIGIMSKDGKNVHCDDDNLTVY